MDSSWILLRLFAIAAGINVVVNLDRERFRWAVYLTKPLLMPLLLAFYLTGAARVNWLVAAGLACGFVGDVLLMLPGEKQHWFMGGLAAFLVNLLLYSIAFGLGAGGWWPLSPLTCLAIAAYLGFGAVMLCVLRRGLGSLAVPVIVYMGVILAMGLSAFFFTLSHDGSIFQPALIGSLFFIASDSILAYDRFRQRLRFGQMLVMATYLVAQFLIAAEFLG